MMQGSRDLAARWPSGKRPTCPPTSASLGSAPGRLAFTTEEIVGALGKSVPAVRAQLRRPKEKGRIADPFRGFHVVVPAKHRRLGCLPADQFVPQLMAHLSQPYDVALLSAAAYHGAAHRKPPVFQVMVPKSRRSLECWGGASSLGGT